MPPFYPSVNLHHNSEAKHICFLAVRAEIMAQGGWLTSLGSPCQEVATLGFKHSNVILTCQLLLRQGFSPEQVPRATSKDLLKGCLL